MNSEDYLVGKTKCYCVIETKWQLEHASLQQPRHQKLFSTQVFFSKDLQLLNQ